MKTHTSEPDELPNLPPLLLDAQPFLPGDGAGVVPRPLARRPLVVEVRDLVQLGVRQEPEVEQRRRETGVDLPARQLDERRERQGHLP